MTLSASVPAGNATAADDSEPCPEVEFHQARFAAVVERHAPLVLGVCRRMLGASDADDAAQAVFVLFWRKARHLKDEPQIASWLHRTAHHVCQNARRSKQARSRHEAIAASKAPHMTPDTGDTAHWREIREILDEEVNRLPERLRVPFVLFHYDRRSLADVAGLLGVPVATVGTWLQRGRERLASQLSRRGVVVGSATLTATLSSQLVTEAVSPTFAATTLHTVSGITASGLAASSPAVAALVKAGVGRGLSRSFWKFASAITLAIGTPVLVLWGMPIVETRNSPDFALLQGDWRETYHESNGAEVNAQPRIEFTATLRITGRSFRRFQTLADGKVLEGESGSFVLDSSSSPAKIDFKLWLGTISGIYELAGDQLTLCVNTDSAARPAQFSTAWNDNRKLTRFERVQP